MSDDRITQITEPVPGENGPELVSPVGPESWVIVDPLDGAWRWFDTKVEAQEYWVAALKVKEVREQHGR